MANVQNINRGRTIDKYLYSTISEALRNILHKKPSTDLIVSSIDSLPTPIMQLGNEWGHNDTVFVESVYDFIERKVNEGCIKFGRLVN